MSLSPSSNPLPSDEEGCESDHFDDEAEEINLDSERLYISIMEWILKRVPRELNCEIIISDKDDILVSHVI